MAEAVYGGKLPQVNNLPHLVCLACVQRLNHFSEYRNIVTETQQKISEDIRTKRCLELSLPVNPPAKVQATAGSRRRSIDFTKAGGTGGQTESSSIHVHVSKFYSCVFYRSMCKVRIYVLLIEYLVQLMIMYETG